MASSLFKYFVVIGIIFTVTGAALAKRVKRRKTPHKRWVPDKDTDDYGRYIGLYDDDCTETLILTPSMEEVEIEIDRSIVREGETTCHWNIIATQNCVIKLNCHKFNLADPSSDEDDPCEEDYYEVTDGSYGYDKFCGDAGPTMLTSGRKLREFYITLQMADSMSNRAVKCIAFCDHGVINGTPLNEYFEPEVDDFCDCGRKPNADRIVGGEDAKKGEFPWMASLVTAGTRKPFCGGSIINDKFILTAAHCFKGPYMEASNIHVLLNPHRLDVTSTTGDGADDRMTDEELENADRMDNSFRYRVEKYFIHPLYIRQTNDFDVALIKLDRAIDFSQIKEVSPVCLPRVGQHLESLAGRSAIISGFGLNSSDATGSMAILQKLELPVLSDQECGDFYGSRFTSRMICAGFKEGGRDSCQGDSGGPLVAEKSREVWEQIGSVSFGEGCAQQGKPGVYINTRQVVQWIRYISNLEDAVWCQGD